MEKKEVGREQLVSMYAAAAAAARQAGVCVFLDHFLPNSSGRANNLGLLQRSPFRILICGYEALRVYVYPMNLWEKFYCP